MSDSIAVQTAALELWDAIEYLEATRGAYAGAEAETQASTAVNAAMDALVEAVRSEADVDYKAGFSDAEDIYVSDANRAYNEQRTRAETAERELAEERAARASLEAALRVIAADVEGLACSDIPHCTGHPHAADCAVGVAARALAGTSTPAQGEEQK